MAALAHPNWQNPLGQNFQSAQIETFLHTHLQPQTCFRICKFFQYYYWPLVMLWHPSWELGRCSSMCNGEGLHSSSGCLYRSPPWGMEACDWCSSQQRRFHFLPADACWPCFTLLLATR
jgi:hypothetical protein